MNNILQSFEIPFQNTFELNYDTVIKLVTDLITADCWGISIDGEVMCNEYDESRSNNEIISQKLVRNYFSDDVLGCNLPHYMLRYNRKTCEIYMYGDVQRAFKLVVNLEKGDPMDSNTHKWTIYFFGMSPLN